MASLAILLLYCNSPWHLWPLSGQIIAPSPPSPSPFLPSFTLQQTQCCPSIFSSRTHAHFFLWCLGGEQLPHTCALLQALSRRGATLPGKPSLRQMLPSWGSPSPTLHSYIYMKIPRSRDRKPPESLRVWSKLSGLFLS